MLVACSPSIFRYVQVNIVCGATLRENGKTDPRASILKGVRRNEPCLYVTLCESERELRTVVAWLGKKIRDRVGAVNPRRVVFDSLSEMRFSTRRRCRPENSRIQPLFLLF